MRRRDCAYDESYHCCSLTFSSPRYLQRFSEDVDILADLVHLQERRARVDPKIALGYLRRVMWGMLYANDACIIPRSSRSLALMMTVHIGVFSIFGLTIQEKKTETMCLPTPNTPVIPIVFKTSRLQYCHTPSSIYLGDTVTESPNLSPEIDRRICAG